MAEHGGYRRPSQPAGVSGPGKYSRRTDGRQPVRDLPDADYGGNKEFREIQEGAQMAASRENVASAAQAPPPEFTPLDAEGDPNSPVTAGVDMGEGPGSDVLNLAPDEGSAADLRSRFGPMIPVLIRMADSSYASASFKEDVRDLLSRI